MLDNTKLQGLFNRSYNSAVSTEQDEKDLKDYIGKVFGDGSLRPDPSMLHQFNNLIVQKADEIFKQKATDMITLLANYQKRAIGDIVQHEIPVKSNVKLYWSANGSGVDLVRVGEKKNILATPKKFATGFYYEPKTFVQQGVEGFREVINLVAEEKLKMYMKIVAEMVQSAIATDVIPDSNHYVGANVTLANYNKVASALSRYGGRPTFVADTLLIDKIALQQATDNVASVLLTDDVKENLLNDLVPTRIGRTVAVNLVNPFVDATNSQTELPVNEGFMFAGGVNAKPFSIVEYGGMAQWTIQDAEDERVQLKLTQEASIDMLYGEAIGYIKDTSVTL